MVEPTGVERKLAAILCADVAGYSRLMGADEEATLRTLNAYREVIDGLVANHRGRVFGSGGDRSLVLAAVSAFSPLTELTTRPSIIPRDGTTAQCRARETLLIPHPIRQGLRRKDQPSRGHLGGA